jgi:hypothetical protein
MAPETIENNKDHSRFEMRVKDDLAFLEYRFYMDEIVLMHTFVPESARGKGAASKLAHFALEYVKEHDLKLKVYCPFVKEYMKLHPEYNTLLDK